MTNWNEKHNWFEDDTLAADWYNDLVRRVKFHIFENQEDILYMAGELGKGRWPKLKGDALDKIEKIVEQDMGQLVTNIVMNCAKDLIDGDIDCDEYTATEINWWFGYEDGDDEAIVGRED